MSTRYKTADLYDRFGESLEIAEPRFRDLGGRASFHGPIATLKVYEDNALVRKRLEEAGHGRVLVIDGAGSLRTALLGDLLGKLGVDNGWSGVVVYGCVRDTDELRQLDLGVKAIGTTPRKSGKRGTGEVDVPVTFAGATFRPGEHLYADHDGIVVAKQAVDG